MSHKSTQFVSNHRALTLRYIVTIILWHCSGELIYAYVPALTGMDSGNTYEQQGFFLNLFSTHNAKVGGQ